MSHKDPTTLSSTRSKWKRLQFVLAGALSSGLLLACTGPADEAENLVQTAVEVQDRDATAVLFQWPWESIAKECTENLGPAGFGYVQTSPVQEHITGDQWWVHYQPVSYELESRLGTREEFESMVQTCNEAGVEVIADVVINHMTGQEGGTGWAGSEFTHTDYPGTYSAADFHNNDCEIHDYTDRWQVQECDLLGLADLDTSANYVQERIAEHIDDLISIGVTGFRIDAAKHMAADDIEGILEQVTDLDGIYIVQEVIYGEIEPIQPEEYEHLGDVHVFAYGNSLKHAFESGDLAPLLDNGGIGEDWDGFVRAEVAGTFVDNHDTERNDQTLSYRDGATYELAQAFTLAWPYGEKPAIQSGYKFDDFDAGPPLAEDGRVAEAECGEGPWTCMHARTSVEGMVGFRNAVGDAPVTHSWAEVDNAIGFSRGDRGHLVLNNGTESIEDSWETGLPAGEYCNVYTGSMTEDECSGETISINDEGEFSVQLDAESAVAIHVNARLGQEGA